MTPDEENLSRSHVSPASFQKSFGSKSSMENVWVLAALFRVLPNDGEGIVIMRWPYI
jgi:hypothetical protein